jgi:hypothetical protein
VSLADTGRPSALGRLLGLILAAGATSSGALAAQAPAVEPGDRVRVTLEADGRIVGDLARFDEAELFLIDGRGGRSIRLDHIARIERRIGRNDYIGRGALIGGGIAFALGGSFGALVVTGLCEEASGCGEDIIPAILVVGGIAGAGGALVGAGIGALASHDIWEAARVPSPTGTAPPLRIGPVSTGGGGLGIGVSWIPG